MPCVGSIAYNWLSQLACCGVRKISRICSLKDSAVTTVTCNWHSFLVQSSSWYCYSVLSVENKQTVSICKGAISNRHSCILKSWSMLLKLVKVWLNVGGGDISFLSCWVLCYCSLTFFENYWALMSNAEHCWALLSIAEHWWALMSIDEHCWALMSTAEHCWALLSKLSIAEHCWALLRIAEHCWALLRW